MPNQLHQSRQFAFNRQGGKCFYCGLRMWLNGQSGPPQMRCTAEHLTARCEGGDNGRSNIVAACWHCNHTRHKCKRPLDPLRYQAKVKRRLARGAWLPRCVIEWANAPTCSNSNPGSCHPGHHGEDGTYPDRNRTPHSRTA